MEILQSKSLSNLVPVYELNLAEFPLFLLSPRATGGNHSIRYSDTIIVENKPLEREWQVTWSQESGPPGQAAQETFFALFQIWKEQGFVSPFINFGSYRNLLMRRNPASNPGKSDYQQLSKTLDCLFNLTISSKNAFYDIERKKHVDVKFHLFDVAFDYKDNHGGPDATTVGTIKASDFLYGAVLRKSLFPLQIDEAVFYRLTGLQRRLLIYLKKMLYNQVVHRRNLMEFARQLPTHAASVSKIRQQIKGGVQFLVDHELISGLHPVQFYKSRIKEDMVQFMRSETRQLCFEDQLKEPRKNAGSPPVEQIVSEIEKRTGDYKSRGNFILVSQRMDYWDDIRPVLADVEMHVASGTKFKPGMLFTTWMKKRANDKNIALFE